MAGGSPCQRLIVLMRSNALNVSGQIGASAPPASISIFYGAGHMDDLERRVRREFGYRAESDLWLPAFTVDYAKAGLSVIEATLLRAMVQRQMQELLPTGKE